MYKSLLALALVAAATPTHRVEIVGTATLFAPGIASTPSSEIRLTFSPDGRTALWFATNRAGGAGGYDIWMSRRTANGWAPATPALFDSPGRDFDPAFSRDGRFVYFSSDRPGGLGGDDVWRVPVTAEGFGQPENLGAAVNSAGREWAPMLSPDGKTLLFASDRPGGAGRHDLYVAAATDSGFQPAQSVPGTLNSAGDEFDATFLADSRTIVYARAADLSKDRIDLFAATPHNGRYDAGQALPQSVNSATDTYGPMIDWSDPARLTFAAKRDGAASMELYTIRYNFRR